MNNKFKQQKWSMEMIPKDILIDKNKRLEQTLKEIQEIAEEDCKQCFEIDGFSKPDDCGICPYNKILQKISEVINEN